VSQIDIEIPEDRSSDTVLPAEIRALIMTELSVSPPIAGRAFGLGTSSAYRAVRSGDIPSTRIGAKFAVPTSWIREQLRLDQAPQPQPQARKPQMALPVARRAVKKRRHRK
jgi:hypothetical protein